MNETRRTVATKGTQMKLRSLTTVLAATAALLVSLAVPAIAAGPPNGQYECNDLGYWFKLKGNDKYTVQTGGGGKWVWKSKRVVFKNGPLDFAYGIFRHDAVDGNPIIDLHDVESDYGYDNCPRI
jgi:hypothetical protein